MSNLPDWMDTLPRLGLSEDKLKAYTDKHINPYSPRHRYATYQSAENTWMYLGRQWFKPQSRLVPSGGAYRFEEISRKGALGSFKRPVTNIIAPAVDNEVARLGRKELVPDTRTGKNDPEWMQAAKLAKDILLWEMSKVMFAEKRAEGNQRLNLEGTLIVRSCWDEVVTDPVMIAPEDPAQCPACKSLFASRRVPRGFATIALPAKGERPPMPMMHSESLRDVPETGEASAMHPSGLQQVQMTHCPFCQEATQLQNYLVSPEEAAGETDVFDRPLGVMVPRGEAAIDILGVHEYYPENGGHRVEPHNARIHHQMVVRPLEWIVQRWPELIDKVKPEPAADLMRLDPLHSGGLLGQPGVGDALGYSASIESYERHARVREVVVDPMPGIPGLEDGLWMVRVCDELIVKPLMASINTPAGPRKVARVKYAFARFKRIPGYFFGRTFVSDLNPVQRRLNEIDAQWIDLRERGKPNVYVPKGTELKTREESTGSHVVVEYDCPDPNWKPGDATAPGLPLSGAEYSTERQACFTDAQRIGAAADIEMGESPGGVKTTSGLMLLSEEASQKRGPREQALAGLYQTIFQHYLDINWAFRREDATYEVQSSGTVAEQKSYRGKQLLGGINVKVDAKAGYDQTLYQKEATGEAMKMGLIVNDGPAARRRILQNMRLPDDINEDQNLQVLTAQQAWSDFLHEKKIPIVDPVMHTAIVWFQVLQISWMKDECRVLRDKVGFDEIFEGLSGWQEKAVQIEAQNAQLEAIYGNYPAEQWPQIYEATKIQQAQVDEATAKAMELTARDSGQEPPPPAQPTVIPPPPKDGLLPKAPAKRIYAIWKILMPGLAAVQDSAKAAADLDAAPEAVDESGLLDQLLQLRAVIETYHTLAQAAAPPPAAGAAPAGGPPPEAQAGAGG